MSIILEPLSIFSPICVRMLPFFIIFFLFPMLGTDISAQTDSSPTLRIDLPVSTQGPLWPPSEMGDRKGNFLVVGGVILSRDASGRVVPVPGQAAIVSKETVPPLDSAGREDFSNQLGSAYRVLRPLYLTPGSEDLNMVLYTTSYGPPEGSWGGGPRIPMEGESKYNLNSVSTPCPELFPAESQRFEYRRPHAPLHKAPIWGFQGNNYVYDPDKGNQRDRIEERKIDFRRKKPITLGEYLAAQGRLLITLTQFSREVGEYTHATFSFRFRHLLPNSLYTIWAIRPHLFAPPNNGMRGRPDPLALPNVFITDHKGNARVTYEVRNPFPDPESEEGGNRIVGLAVDFHSDFQNWGACFARVGVGIDIHTHFNTRPNGILDITNFVTEEPPNN